MFLSTIKIKKKDKKFEKSAKGRNNQGRIVVRHKGGGHKRLKRKINWNSLFKDSMLVGLQYNPAFKLSLFQWYSNSKKSMYYTPAFQNYSILDKNLSFRQESLICSLSSFEIGDKINNLGFNNKLNSKYIKSPGTFGVILQRYTWVKNYMLVQLPSGEQKLFKKDERCCAFSLVDGTNLFEKIKKAGRNRWLGRRPHVRGVAMNPIDHPHGGGEGKTSGGRPSVSPLGKLTKNVKTRNNKRDHWKIFLK